MKTVEQHNDGYIKQMLDLYDQQTKLWGNGLYAPKFISTNYTLLNLVDIKINPDTKIYHDSLKHYLDAYYQTYINKVGMDKLDLCIAGMFIRLISYAKIKDERLDGLIDLVFEHKMSDGGFNCAWFRKPYPKISSVHTTMNVLEGFSEYLKKDYTYRKEDVSNALKSGVNVLLERNLVYKKGTNIPIHKEMLNHHYPPRWKYDYLRVLEFLAKEKVK